MPSGKRSGSLRIFEIWKLRSANEFGIDFFEIIIIDNQYYEKIPTLPGRYPK